MDRGHYEEKQKRFLRLFEEIETDPEVVVNDEGLPVDRVETIDILEKFGQ